MHTPVQMLAAALARAQACRRPPDASIASPPSSSVQPLSHDTGVPGCSLGARQETGGGTRGLGACHHPLGAALELDPISALN